MPCCAIITCRTKSQTSSIDRGGISFHRFPKEPNIKEQWIDATGRENWMPTKSSTICSSHFNENDFIIKKSGNRYLKPGAIPKERIVHIYTSSLPSVSVIEKPCIDAITSDSQKICDLQGADNAKTITSNLVLTTPEKDKSLKRGNTEDILKSSSSASTPTKRKLQNIIINNEYVIKKQRLQIKRVQAQNRRLKTKLNKIEEIFGVLQEKFSFKIEDVVYSQEHKCNST